MRAALKLHAVLVVGSCGGLVHLQSLEQPLLRPVRQHLGAALNSTRWCSLGERKAGDASIVAVQSHLVHASGVLCDRALNYVLESRTILSQQFRKSDPTFTDYPGISHSVRVV